MKTYHRPYPLLSEWLGTCQAALCGVRFRQAIRRVGDIVLSEVK